MYMSASSDTGASTALTTTTVGATQIWQDTANGARVYSQFRVITSANTNVTYRVELYAFENR